jgi:hypothetical protein
MIKAAPLAHTHLPTEQCHPHPSNYPIEFQSFLIEPRLGF